jgi:hypothetical protein
MRHLTLEQRKLQYTEEQRSWKPDVVWLFGPKDTGKTRYVQDKHEKMYTHTGGKFFDGYDAHEVLLLDNIKISKKGLDFVDLLHILDPYPCRVEIRWAPARQMLARTIYITSRFHPRKYVPNDEEEVRLLRRIDTIIEFPMDLTLI